MKLQKDVLEPISLSLTPYTGVWTVEQASHLLRRTLFGATFQQIQQAVTDGMNASVAQLLVLPTTNPPLTVSPQETVAPFGTTWVNSLYPSSGSIPAVEAARVNSLASWVMERLNQPTISIQEKMQLFWVNHFGVENTNDPKVMYQLNELVRANCLGDFKQLVKDVSINPMMLIFLNGASNNQFSPNENYSRELLELFTVGKGEQVATGDYSTYTETDIAAGAKILTGWNVQDLYSTTVTNPSSVFNTPLHDTSSKTLSGYFGNSVVTDAGATEYSNYIDIIFQQPNMAKHICRKIYRWFVNYDLTPTVEATVISDMATTLAANNFSVLTVMNELLKSEHFYDVSVRGAIIKNPLEYMYSILNSTQSKPSFDLVTNYTMYLNIYDFCALIGMDYLRPPSVGGWTSYYQAPSYSKLWANSSLIKLRFEVAAYLTVTPGLEINGNFFKVDALTFLNGLSIPSDAPQVIDDIITVFTPKGVSASQKAILKTILTNGQPDFEWTIQYNDYLADPSNPVVSTPVRQRVEFVLYSAFQMPEAQTI